MVHKAVKYIPLLLHSKQARMDPKGVVNVSTAAILSLCQLHAILHLEMSSASSLQGHTLLNAIGLTKTRHGCK